MKAGALAVAVGPTCTACGACIITCPERALRPAPLRPVVDTAACTGCLECIEVCPASAISAISAATAIGAFSVAEQA